MNKLWYSLAFTLLGGSSAIAQDITQEVTALITEDQQIVSETSAPQPQKNNDEQTIFFTDDSVIDEIEAEQAESVDQTDNANISDIPQTPEKESLALLPEDVIAEDEMIAAEIAAQAIAEAEEISSPTESAETMTERAETISPPNTPQLLIPEAADEPIIPIENNSIEDKDVKTEEAVNKLPLFAPEILPNPLDDEPQKIDHTPEITEEIMPKDSEETETVVDVEAPVETKEVTPDIDVPQPIVETKQEIPTPEVKISLPLVSEESVLEPDLKKEIIPEVKAPIEPVKKTIPEAKPFTLPAASNSLKPKGPFALDETAPINSNIMGDSGFAPSLLNKKIGISPEQRAKMMMKQKYDEMDANGDGVISEEEFVKYKTEESRKIAYEIFKRVDKNSNKNLSVYEYEILMNKMIESYIKAPK